MKIYKYKIPFKSNFKTVTATYAFREGLILELNRDGIKCYGEVAPLPSFSLESMEDSLYYLKKHLSYLESIIELRDFSDLLEELPEIDNFPALRFGLEMLNSSFLSSQENKTLHHYLFGTEISLFEINAVLGSQDIKSSISKIDNLKREGYQTIKIKVGLDIEKEAALISEVRKSFPSLRIRIDANESWTVEEAISNLKELEEFDIEYCEQPVNRNDINGLAFVRNQSKIKVAADESCRNKKDALILIQQDVVDVLIIKPSLYGKTADLFVTSVMAKSHGIDLVFTSALESYITRRYISTLASGLGSLKYAQGLGTGNLFEKDIFDFPDVVKGRLNYNTNTPTLNFNLLNEV